ncbi:MAG: DNA-binding protein [Prevotella sp.]|nr:DNA-binding protein [Prevotella sp.]MBQ8702300.1 DNA-binding protein [Prevotella sp.]
MLHYKLYKNNSSSEKVSGLWFARAYQTETYDLKKLCEHMSEHDTPFSPGVISGVLKDMIRCVKELALDGKSVKLDDLGIFSIGIHSTGAESPAKFDVKKNINSVRLRCRATGSFSTSALKLNIKVGEYGKYSTETVTP